MDGLDKEKTTTILIQGRANEKEKTWEIFDYALRRRLPTARPKQHSKNAEITFIPQSKNLHMGLSAANGLFTDWQMQDMTLLIHG